jgi:hypothetical protein
MILVETDSSILKPQFAAMKHKYWEVISLFAAYFKRKSLIGRMVTEQ